MQRKIVLLVSLTALLAANATAEPNEPRIVPGREVTVKVDDKRIGGGMFTLYIPADYNDANEWPVIFYYHGAGQKPSTGLFRRLTRGKGFIIVGLEYVKPPAEKMLPGEYIKYLKSEIGSIGAVRLYLKRQLRLRIDNKRIILAGLSKGGWMVFDLVEQNPRPWAGIVIIAAGRGTVLESKKHTMLKDKPIYIGVGEKDPNRSAAVHAENHYRRRDANVTFELYRGLGHAADPNSAKLAAWLRAVAKDPAKTEQSK